MSQLPETEGLQYDARRRVLVVDDEPTLRLGFAYALSNRTTAVETAATGRQALERIAEVRFDIIILDLRMPDLDGLGVIDELRRQGNNVAIVLCSAALSPGSALRAIRKGVVDFLPKPVRPVDLRKVVEFVLRPENQPLPLALRAARNGLTAEAMRILSGEPSPSRQAASWLETLKSIQVADGCDRLLEERILRNLPMLVFSSERIS